LLHRGLVPKLNVQRGLIDSRAIQQPLGEMMAASLTQEQGLVLVKRLATDDDFRSLFERDPAEALSQAGVPKQTIASLSSECFQPRVLAPKAEFESLANNIGSEAFIAAMTMRQPNIK
jgi:putative modified peptide